MARVDQVERVAPVALVALVDLPRHVATALAVRVALVVPVARAEQAAAVPMGQAQLYPKMEEHPSLSRTSPPCLEILL